MYAVEKAPYGFKITLADRVTMEEAQRGHATFREILDDLPRPFGVVVDIRALKPMLDDVQKVVDGTQRLARESGLRRSAVVLASAVMSMQFTRIAKETGVYEHERYIDASKDPNWEQAATAWIVDGVDPDSH